MAKQEFNDKGRDLKAVYDALGVEQPVLSAADEARLEKSLEALKKIREQDPDFEDAIRKVVEAEAKYGKDDPAEGKVIVTKHKAPKRSK